jgi:hypothetical protein
MSESVTNPSTEGLPGVTIQTDSSTCCNCLTEKKNYDAAAACTNMLCLRCVLNATKGEKVYTRNTDKQWFSCGCEISGYGAYWCLQHTDPKPVFQCTRKGCTSERKEEHKFCMACYHKSRCANKSKGCQGTCGFVNGTFKKFCGNCE